MKSLHWSTLPAELHLAVVAVLPLPAIRALARTNRTSHALCLPALYAHVALPDTHALHAFATHVPRPYLALVASLSVCTTGGTSCTDALVHVLSATTSLQSLSLSLAASVDPHKLIPAFEALTSVRTLSITNCGSETLAPM